ncbi:MAG TPA: cache domain-containing protein [Ktedonobacteraceae bacterium]|jgi:hypothetical protein
MSSNQLKPARRRRLSLSFRVTFWLVATAIIPLLGTVFLINELMTKPALINTATTVMENDASAHTQLIDRYLKERTLDAQTLVQIPSLQTFMALPPNEAVTDPANYQDQATHAVYALVAGVLRDKNYTNFAVFNPQGTPMLSYPQKTPPMRGNSFVPSQYIKAVQTKQFIISDVYYDQTTHKASVDIYAPVVVQNDYLGFMRATLNLDYIWSVVQGDKDSNGRGSYAFILDQNGVYIAEVDNQHLFTAVTPLSGAVTDRLHTEDLYGGNVQNVADSALRSANNNTQDKLSFQAKPATAREPFQIARVHTDASIISWSYFVLSPVSTVTAVATQQLFSTIFTAAVVSLLVAIIGLLVGNNLGRPILSSVESLRSSSDALSVLASKEQDAASEQMWVVDSSQVGLQSVQYYTEATAVAAQQLSKIGENLGQNWKQMSGQEIYSDLSRMAEAARYIEEAASYQEASTQKLATALKVATQVTEQLVAGTTSATDAAAQLERVVERLREVVGK